MLDTIRSLIKKFRQGSKRLYRSGWVDPRQQQGPVETMDAVQWSPNRWVPTPETSEFVEPKSSTEDKREEKRPVDIVHEIIAEEPKMNLTNLKAQIRLVEKRKKILEETHANTGDETLALTFLEARKKFLKYHSLFQWQVTTREKIQQLCAKYKVQQVVFASFSRNVPMEAIEELEKYLEAYAKVTDRGPSLTLIIDAGGKETKKDPILLAGSPFGTWYYILGAWDKEVEIVDDLVYKGK